MIKELSTLPYIIEYFFLTHCQFLHFTENLSILQRGCLASHRLNFTILAVHWVVFSDAEFIRNPKLFRLITKFNSN